MASHAAAPGDDDPVLALVRAAPLVEADAAEAAAFEEGLAAIQAGETISQDELRARLKNRPQE